MKFSIIGISIAAASLTAQSPSPNRSQVTARIDSLVNDYLAAGPTASAAVGVVRGRDTILMRGYGYADIGTHRAAGPATVYEIGSITKQFTSSAIMRLVEQHKINLDDDMSKYVPDFPMQGHHVTIRQLLNHTSGIHSYTSEAAWRPHWADDLSPDSIVGFIKRDTFDFAPGSAWRYNNTGYVLLGMIIEKVTGQPYATYLDEQFFRPLGLRQTRYCPNHPTDTTFAIGYSPRAGQIMPSEYLSLTQPFAAGALCSTVRDFLVWQRALHNGRVVSAASYAAMTTPETLTNGIRLTYGFGLQIAQLGAHRVIVHGGGINGFTTAQYWIPDDSLSVIVFTNGDGQAPDALSMNIGRVVLNMPLVSRPRAAASVPLDPKLRDAVVGTYEFASPTGNPFVVHFYVENGQLMSKADGPGQGAFPMLYHGNNTFGASVDPSLRVIFSIENGIVSGATLNQGAESMKGTRRP